LQGTSQLEVRTPKQPRMEGKIGRGRKKLSLDTQVLYDAFGERG
jgi:hypothetical protein